MARVVRLEQQVMAQHKAIVTLFNLLRDDTTYRHVATRHDEG